jgi:hypothetical protein
MTLDDFLSALENLIEDRELDDDDPGEGNFGCEDCRACNNCRFCLGCDSCEDCTYCEECIDCTSCTQSKRCVGCEKVSYCEDCRDCKNSRYLTLCVSCTNSVHCLACVGLDGGEFYVLNEKRTRKEYFALLRQIQEVMTARMAGGWRPPGIGLASEIFDPAVADHNAELHAAPWLDEREPSRNDYRDEPRGYEDRRGPSPAREPERDWDARRAPAREDYGRRRPSYEPEPEPRRSRAPRHEDDYLRHERPEPRREQPEPRREQATRDSGRDWMREPPQFGTSYADEPLDERGRGRARDERGQPRPRHDYGSDLGRDLGQDEDDWNRETVAREPGFGRDLGPYERDGGHGREPGPSREPSYDRDPGYGRSAQPPADPGYGRSAQPPADPGYGPEPSYDRERGYDREREPDYARVPDYGREPDSRAEHDVPHRHEHQQTQPFDRRESGPREPSRPAARDSHERGRPLEDDLRGLEIPPERAPEPREREPSSPWLEDNPTQARRRAKRGSLRRAGRPKRPPESSGSPEGTGTGTSSGSYRTGSAPERTGSEGTHTGTGLRLGRRPKRRRQS